MTFIEELETDFYDWLAKQKLSTQTRNTYARKIEKIRKQGAAALEKAIYGSKDDRLSLRAFLRFLYENNYITLEEHDRYKKLVKLLDADTDEREYTDEDIIKLLLWAQNEKSRKYYLYLRLCIESGLRRKHAVIAYNKILQNFYTDLRNGTVRVALFEKEAEKKAFYCYCSKQLANEIISLGETINYNTVKKKLKKVLFNAIRKWWLDVALDAKISESIADFIQGRAADTTRAKYYIKKRKRADKEYINVLKLIEKRIYSKTGVVLFE